MVEIYLVAQKLSETILKELCFQDLSLVLTAISASSACEATDYQKLEFLGDVLLKLLSTISVAVNHPQYPEGYLSTMRTKIVSNSRLCRSTVDTELDKFILTKEFTGQKWKPFYVDELSTAEDVSGTRRLSTKVLADIVESLTGAAFIDGRMGTSGMKKSLACLKLLLPDTKWHSLDEGRDVLASLKETKVVLSSNFVLFEKMLGYTFKNKTLLIEALTHGSFNLGTSEERSYERLEFIGDAILDYVVVLKLWERGLPQSLMSPLRAACVNADLIGFLGMEWTIPQETSDLIDGRPTTSTIHTPFWKFMRHTSTEIGGLQRDTEIRHGLERGPIMEAIQNSSTYPWTLLAHLHIPKFFSDIFESVIGAVWLDSGDLSDCAAIVERIKILPYLDRILNEGVDVFHPKNKLGEIAEQNKVNYVVERQGEQLSCKVYVGEEMVVEVDDGLNKDEVITKAAEKAHDILMARKDAGVQAADANAMDLD
ncbi:Dicer-like protein 2 [Pestalotiopsis sp. 9143b]|nr:Dicer-like protein 2 [Pestalotiopsis sp. 9143b]